MNQLTFESLSNRGRIRDYYKELYRRSDWRTGEVSFPQHMYAQAIGCSRKTISRLTEELASLGFIEVVRRKVKTTTGWRWVTNKIKVLGRRWHKTSFLARRRNCPNILRITTQILPIQKKCANRGAMSSHPAKVKRLEFESWEGSPSDRSQDLAQADWFGGKEASPDPLQDHKAEFDPSAECQRHETNDSHPGVPAACHLERLARTRPDLALKMGWNSPVTAESTLQGGDV